MKKKILVVDDEVGYESILRYVLQRAGYDMEICRFGANVLHRVMAGDIDLVLLDYFMPDEKGDRICQNIRSVEKLKDLPIMIMTGHYEMGEEFFKEIGANEVVYKPLNHEELVGKLGRLLRPIGG